MPVNIYEQTSADALSLTELDLYHQIMDYRTSEGLDEIPLSAGLTTTAGRHALDSYENIEAAGVTLPSGYSSPSWIHSWSDDYYNGSDPSVMWDAPERLGTSYTANGYEISVAGAQSIEQTLAAWQNSPSHNPLLVNTGQWADSDWSAIGIGVEFNDVVSGGSFSYGNYFNVWFGEQTDPGGPPRIEGTTGADDIELTAFDDLVASGAGNDTVRGGAGNDTFLLGGGANTFVGGAGTDTVRIGAPSGQVTVEADGGAILVTLNGSTSRLTEIERLAFSNVTLTAQEAVNGAQDEDPSSDGGTDMPSDPDPSSDSAFPPATDGGEIANGGTAAGGEGELMVGDAGANQITGTDGQDTIAGVGGDDTLLGGEGDDQIAGSNGNNSIRGEGGSDNIGGGVGDNSIRGGSGNDTIGAGQGNDEANGGAGDDIVNGGAGNDMIWGETGNDTSGAGFNDDTVSGGAGDDSLGGGTGMDVLAGHSGNDSIGGGEGDDLIDGGTGDDFLAGGGRNDTIYGGDGADDINGGEGDDVMSGGAGADVFIWNTMEAGDTDVITDFADGVNSLRLTGIENAPGTGLDGKLDALNVTDATVNGTAGIEIDYQGQVIRISGISADAFGLEDVTFL